MKDRAHRRKHKVRWDLIGVCIWMLLIAAYAVSNAGTFGIFSSAATGTTSLENTQMWDKHAVYSPANDGTLDSARFYGQTSGTWSTGASAVIGIYVSGTNTLVDSFLIAPDGGTGNREFRGAAGIGATVYADSSYYTFVWGPSIAGSFNNYAVSSTGDSVPRATATGCPSPMPRPPSTALDPAFWTNGAKNQIGFWFTELTPPATVRPGARKRILAVLRGAQEDDD